MVIDYEKYSYLVIDDFEQMRVSLKSMLVALGAKNIVLCNSGEEALKRLAHTRFDVVVCDYNLGEGKDGQQILEEARHLGYLSCACTFFMVTAESNMPMVLGALEQQPDEYMVKPVNADVLQLRLSTTLKRKQQLQVIDEAITEGDKAGAIALCIKHQKQSNDSKQKLYLTKLHTELCLELERYDEAEAVYSQMLKIRNFPWAKFGLGRVAYYKNELNKAESIFRELIEENRLYLEAYDWLSKVLQAKDDIQQAQELLSQAVSFSPKLVKRQRKLGNLALVNKDLKRAERAFSAAVRWGVNSCFAQAEEYRRLAEVHLQNGHQSKVLKLLADGRKRFVQQPTELIKVICGQAQAKSRMKRDNEIDELMQEVEQLVDEHKGVIPSNDLLEAATDLFRLSKNEQAQGLLKVVLCNHHDEDQWSDQVRRLMVNNGLESQADTLIENSRSELIKLHDQCLGLMREGGLEQAISLLNETADQYPANRTIVLMGISAMIKFMRTHGIDPSYHFRCRFSLNRLLEKDQGDTVANRFLGDLNQLPV
jgi:CheY-like chemotaxis protein